MQHFTRLAARGYFRYLHGEVRADNVLSLIDKLDQKFQFELSKDQKYRRKKQKFANAEFLLHPIYGEKRFQWFVLFTEGKQPELDREKHEKSISKRRERLIFDKRFELIKSASSGGIDRWTWRLVKSTYDSYEASIIDGVRNRGDDRELTRIVDGISVLPGFRGIREQTRGLLKLLDDEWRRNRKEAVCPHTRSKMAGYLRLIPKKTIGLDFVIDRLDNGLTPFDPSWVRDRRILES